MEDKPKRRIHRKKASEDYVRPNLPGHKYGRKTILKPETELELQIFLIDCYRLRIPRTISQFKMDVQFLVVTDDMTVPFKNGIPGDYWIERFGKSEDGHKMDFPNEDTVKKMLKEDISLSQYMKECEMFITDHNFGNLLDDPRKLNFIEVTLFAVSDNLDMTLAIIFNADGDILPPIILHNNSIPQDILELYDDWIYFYETPDGHIDSVTLENIIFLMSDYVEKCGIVKPVVLFMDNILSCYFTFVTWRSCEKEVIIPQCLPESVTKTYGNMNIGVSHVLVPKILTSLSKRYTEHNKSCTSTVFTELVREHTKSLKMKIKIREDMKKFTINKLFKIPKTTSKTRKRKRTTCDVQTQFEAAKNLNPKTVLYTPHMIIQIL